MKRVTENAVNSNHLVKILNIKELNHLNIMLKTIRKIINNNVFEPPEEEQSSSKKKLK